MKMSFPTVLLFVAGLFILWAGAELLVRAAVRIAVRLGVSSAVVGLTVVAYGTSLPELLVGVVAAVNKRGMIVYGDVVGSNILNLSFVLGLAAFVGVVLVERRMNRFVLPFLVGATALLIVLSIDEKFSRVDAAAFLIIMAVYQWFLLGFGVKDAREQNGDESASRGMPLGVLVLAVIVGFVMLWVGAYLMVESAVSIARALGVSERVIALTIVAVGTSLPEAATAVVAAVRRHSALGLGGLVGSNVFNTLLILGVSGLISPIALNARDMLVDYTALGAFTLAAMLFGFTGRIGRVAGILMMLGYAAYLAVILL